MPDQDAADRLQAFFLGQDIMVNPDTLVPDNEPAPTTTTATMSAHKGKGAPGSKQSKAKPRPAKKQQNPSDSDDSNEPTVSKVQAAQAKQVKSGYRHVLRENAVSRALDMDDVSANDVRRSQPVDPTGLGCGELSPKGQDFAPWRLVQEYPNHLIGKANKPIANPFFDFPALWDNQVWDFYYLHSLDAGGRPILLVPTAQVQHLLRYINSALGINLRIPVGLVGEKYAVQFGLGGTPRPRYLGRTTSHAEFLVLKEKLSSLPAQPVNGVTPQAEMLFREQMENIHKLPLTASAEEKKRKKDAARVAQRQAWGQTTKRVQRYLGLREKATSNFGSGPEMGLQGLDLAAAHEDVRFVCVDVENFEDNQELVTEVGLAVLDTSVLRGIPPGDKCENWFGLIQNHHFIVKENEWATNGKYVPDNQQNFRFGLSQTLPQAAIRKKLASIMGAPVSDSSASNTKKGNPALRVVFVAHDVNSDVEHLKKIGYDAKQVPNIFEKVDTQHMFSHWQRKSNSTKLERVLANLCIRYRFLHNAGNDAAYTMQAMLRIAQDTRNEGLDRALGKKTEKPTSAKPAVEDDVGGWDSDGGDGGDPVPLGCNMSPW